MRRSITGFNPDDEGHWRAELDCGHLQHVRHDPPLTKREWVLTDESCASRIGATLECRKCDEGAPPDLYPR